MAVTHRHLEAFHAVIQSGGFTRAAKLLRTSQPSISRLIAELQDSLAFPLFSRVQGRTVPTAEALVFHQEVERSFTGVDKILQHAERIRTHRVGHLNILSMPALAQAFLPRVLAGFLRDHPGVSASLQVQRSDAIPGWMTTQQFDIGFAMLAAERPGLETELFDPSPSVCIMPPDHPLAARRTVEVQDLAGLQLVGSGPNSVVQRALGLLLAEQGVQPDITVETPITAIACELVASGAGVTIVDPFTAQSYRDRGLVVRPFMPQIAFTISALYPEGRPRPALVGRFLAAMRQARDGLYRDLAARPPPPGAASSRRRT
ncbi:LysR substrate-binding domain-containing protein [Roseomonas sp. OT10]|uniref:LysR substrate-binding domain-containing protein n=1 Tax=Roseomonas cutis TaxID=2897332 RepID=UPI001E47F3C8|nr:LysR substrate-binding domain-containing protein [Roseomonas sp. OT10]UFN47884.1 LysR substrate-binding domain-containing protein [Roseomonas sp. OT10]